MSSNQNRFCKRGNSEEKALESNRPRCREARGLTAHYLPNTWPPVPDEAPMSETSGTAEPEEPADENPTRTVFGPPEESMDDILYPPDNRHLDTELDRARNNFWELDAIRLSSSVGPGIILPLNPGLRNEPLSASDSDTSPNSASDGSEDSHLLDVATRNPENFSIFSPEHPYHRNHHPLQTEERIEPPATEENQNHRVCLPRPFGSSRLERLVVPNDELERIDPPGLEEKHDAQLSQSSDLQTTKSERLVVPNDELERIDPSRLKEKHDGALSQSSDMQPTKSEHLITRNEELGRLSYGQRRKLKTLLYVIYKLPILLLLFVAALADVHKPFPYGHGQSDVSSSISSRSIILPAYWFVPASRKRKSDTLSTSIKQTRPRMSQCDLQDGITRFSPVCHHDDCLGSNNRKRCSEQNHQWFNCLCWLVAPEPRKPCPFVPPWPEWRLDTALFFGVSGDPTFWSAQAKLFNEDNRMIHDSHFYPEHDSILQTPMGSFHPIIAYPGDRHKMTITWSWKPNSWDCEGMRKGPRFIGGPGVANGLVRLPGSFFYGLERAAGGVGKCNEQYASTRRPDGVYEIRWSCGLTPEYWIGL